MEDFCLSVGAAIGYWQVGARLIPRPESGDMLLSYLTLAHIFRRAVEEFCLSVGAAIGYWQVGARLIPKP